MNKKWIGNDGRSDSIPTYDEIVHDDDDDDIKDKEDDEEEEDVDAEDEALDELQDNFEHAYNFRFEEPYDLLSSPLLVFLNDSLISMVLEVALRL
jgi:hypothetical protein